jgi:SRSO17 transposase
LPQNWAEDRKRRRKAGVPEEISFKTKPESALEHLRKACGTGVACGVVLTAAGSGIETHLCTNITTLGLSDVTPHATEHHDLAVRHGAVAAQKMVGRGRSPKLMRHGGSQKLAATSMLQCSIAKPSRRKNS